MYKLFTIIALVFVFSLAKADEQTLEVKENEILVESCEVGLFESCFNLATRYELGDGVEQDIKKAISLYNNGCTNEHFYSCYNLANLYAAGSSGEEAELAKKLAQKFWEQACEGGISKSCFNVGVFLIYHMDQSPEQLSKGASYVEKACAEEVYESCETLAQLYSKGVGVEEDGTKAFDYSLKACEMGKLPRACMFAGSLQHGGIGTEKNVEKAITLIQKSCNLGFEQACSYLN